MSSPINVQKGAEHFADPMTRRRKRRALTSLSGGDSPSPPLINSRVKTRKGRPMYISLRCQLSPPDTSLLLRPLRHYYTRRISRRIKQPQKPLRSLLQRPSLPLENSQALDDNVALLFATSDDDTSTTLKGFPGRLRGRRGGPKDGSRDFGGGVLVPEVHVPRIRVPDKERNEEWLQQKWWQQCEEKWVRYSEVVEKEEEEVSSNYCNTTAGTVGGLSCLSLKLDYQEVLDAWSDKGSLFL